MIFKYGRKNAKILLPLEEYQCGNILDGEWEGVEIWCDIPNYVNKLNPTMLTIGKLPIGFAPKRIIY